MSEGSLWKWMRKTVLPKGHYTRVESDSSAGFPDVHYTIDCFSGTMELKYCRHLKAKQPLKRGGFLPSQIKWITDEFIEGGWTVLVVELDDWVYFYHPTHIERINDWKRTDFESMYQVAIKKRNVTASNILNLKDFLRRKGY